MGVSSECLKGYEVAMAIDLPIAAMGAPIIIGRARQLILAVHAGVHAGLANRVPCPYRRASHQPQRGDGKVGT
jgi:hypothetical protein